MFFVFFIDRDFSNRQKESIKKLMKIKQVEEIRLYESGMALVITDNEVAKDLYLLNTHRTYFITAEGEIEAIGYGVTRWSNPVKVIKKESLERRG